MTVASDTIAQRLRLLQRSLLALGASMIFATFDARSDANVQSKLICNNIVAMLMSCARTAWAATSGSTA